MLRTCKTLLLGILTITALAGCDYLALDQLPLDAAKLIGTEKGMQSGTMQMDQIQQRDQLQLKDGTGVNCRNNGDCTGARDQLQQRLRDGSCQQ